MFNNFEIVLMVVTAASVAVAFGSVLVPALKKKKIDVNQAFDNVQAGLKVADGVVKSVEVIAPALPGVAIVDKAIEWAEKGVNAAEQLSNSAQISDTARNDEAISFVKSALTTAGVTVTDDINTVIKGAVESAVLALPKSITAASADAVVTDPALDAVESAAANDTGADASVTMAASSTDNSEATNTAEGSAVATQTDPGYHGQAVVTSTGETTVV